MAADRGARFVGADLAGASFRDCDLTGLGSWTRCWATRGSRATTRRWRWTTSTSRRTSPPSWTGATPSGWRCGRRGRWPTAARQALVTRALDGLTDGDLARVCASPPAPGYPDQVRTVARCLRVVLDEECEHHRYAVRDLAVLEGAARR